MDGKHSGGHHFNQKSKFGKNGGSRSQEKPLEVPKGLQNFTSTKAWEEIDF